ncbi:MFS transporter [Paenibacillus allorhizosphaerae]|uniref:Staphyloferrin B transporter n=1 Tax=Paenibacillus allorhizosphaerae TaxID=2849866 RepID=A0ABN7TBY9_9BACL|nr:MFS transporter [Paenibacillus allorhizosphaerae]CAG7619321.1 Staphyloferrin B transporter [Paenibacillus allorhizosphaerae]
MDAWKRNLYILWFGNFFCTAGFSMIVPFLPLYVQELGIHDEKQAALWSALIFGINHVMVALVSPFWGKMSDTYGQKTAMIRSGFGLTIIIVCMGLVHTPMQLLLLRAVFGTMAGFSTSSVALMAIETPKSEVGRALGTLQTGQVTGQLLGPLLGGLMAEWFGMRNSFFLTGLFILTSTVLVLFGVKEAKKYEKFRFRRFLKRDQPVQAETDKPVQKTMLREAIRQSPVILVLFVSTYLIAASLQSISPIISLYVKSMHVEDHIELMAGLIFASSALGTVIAAPYLGKLGDRYGHMIILLSCLLLISILYIPQARISNPWILMGTRFLTGLCVGGLIPSISSLLRRLTPVNIQGSVYAYNASANSLGNVSGALFGGIVASNFGIPIVFYIISGVLFIHFLLLTPQYGRIGREAIKRGNTSY